jgi:outer membrane lipoprotein-sorting protein
VSSLFAWSESLESIRKTAEQVKSISASFVQEKHLVILKKPLISKGLLYFKKPDALRWEYQSPIASILMSYRGKTARFLKRDGVFIKDIGSHIQVMQVVLNEITNWLGGRFNEGNNFVAKLEKTGLVVLRPSNPQMTKMISHIEILLSEQPGLIESVTIFENKKSFTKLVFQNTKLNDTLEPSLFQNP